MKTEIFVRKEDGARDFGLQVRLVGETSLERVFLSHLQIGHAITLNDVNSYAHGELQIVLHNERLGKVEKPKDDQKRNRK